jgi:hypothetical protein
LGVLLLRRDDPPRDLGKISRLKLVSSVLWFF